MSKRPKWATALGLPPIRQWWREIERLKREEQAQEREMRKARDRRRRKCRCEAYPWPHRPGGGLCRYPDPPLQRWQPRPGGRPYRKRYTGILRQIARANGLHPIKDRALIEALLPAIIGLAKQFKCQCPRLKYRNMEIIDKGGGRYSLRGN